MVFASFANEYARQAESKLIAAVAGGVIGISLALIRAFLARDDELPASADSSTHGAIGLARKYLVFVLAGLLFAKFAYDEAMGLAGGELQAFYMLGFLLGLVLLSMLMPRLRLGRNI